MDDLIGKGTNGQVFKVVFVGWSLGILIIFAVPVLGAAFLLALDGRLLEALLLFVMLPFIALCQGVLIGLVVCFGVAVYRAVARTKSSVPDA